MTSSRPPSSKSPARPTTQGEPVSRWSPLNAEARADDRPVRRQASAQSEKHDATSAPAGKSQDARKSKDDWKLKSPRRKFRDERLGRRKPKDGDEQQNDGLHLLYGIHSVSAALKNPHRRFKRLLATENGALRLAEDGPLPIEPVIVKAEEIGRRLTGDAVHQGVLLEAEPLEPVRLQDLKGKSLVLALDQVTDPHNVGAILRSCAAFNVAALLITERHSPEVTGVMAKAASGALEHVPFAVVRNLADALETLKSEGFLCVGFDSDAETTMAETPLRAPLLMVMGAEGRGLRQKTRATCSVLTRLDMPGAIKSLNVSNATAIALYAATTALGKP